MADWVYPASETITGLTKIKDADNKIQNAMNDLTAWANGTAPHVGVGLKDDVIAYVAAIVEDTAVVEW